jgi:hypothetical protein
MLVRVGRNFDAAGFMAQVAATGAQFVIWLKSLRDPPVPARLPDGPVLSVIGGVQVRLITAAVTVTCADGTRYGDSYRLATTLLDHRAYPASALVTVYHERWEHEVAYLALRHTLLNGRVLRSQDPAGRRHRPRRPGQPAPPTPPPRLRPESQVTAQPLESPPARQAPDQPADHQPHHRNHPYHHEKKTRRPRSWAPAPHLNSPALPVPASRYPVCPEISARKG